jgi:putative thioredoxin
MPAQLRVQSIPTVYAFWQGQPVDGFQGALPPSQVDQFVAKLAELGGDGGLTRPSRRPRRCWTRVRRWMRRRPSPPSPGGAREPARLCGARARDDPGGRPRPGRGDLNGAPGRRSRASPRWKPCAPRSRWRGRPPRRGRSRTCVTKVERDPQDHHARFEPRHWRSHATGDVQGAVDQLSRSSGGDREWDGGAAKTSSSRSSTPCRPRTRSRWRAEKAVVADLCLSGPWPR